MPDEQKSLEAELAAVLNRRSMENGSNTPDFILAEYLRASLAVFDEAVNARARWYGRADTPGAATTLEADAVTLPEDVSQKTADLMRETVELCHAYAIPPDEYLQLCDTMKDLRAEIAKEIAAERAAREEAERETDWLAERLADELGPRIKELEARVRELERERDEARKELQRTAVAAGVSAQHAPSVSHDVACLRERLTTAATRIKELEGMGWGVIRRADREALTGEHPIETIRRIMAEDAARQAGEVAHGP